MQLVKDNSNPWNLEKIPYERYLVEFTDSLIDIAKRNGSKSRVETSHDWKTLDYIYRGWRILFPQTSKEFEDHMKNWRLLATKGGLSKEKNALIQHKLEIPLPLYQMIKTIFPDQKWNKEFVKKFSQNFGSFRGSDKL